MLRTYLLAAWLLLQWQRLAEHADDAQVAAIAAKAAKEARYHRAHAADWVVRLGDGTDESARRMRAALQQMWPYAAELFRHDEWRALEAPWRADVAAVLADAQLALPPPSGFVAEGTHGRHSEHMGRLLAEMQVLQRAYPGGVW
jgi:ring-1,2-phenylacetyl-CoA epoxidase subunit PaaC